MKDKNISLRLLEIDAWQDGDEGEGIGWAARLLELHLPSGNSYALIGVTWRGGWQPKMLGLSLFADQFHVSTYRDFVLGPIWYAPGDGLHFNAWSDIVRGY